MSDAIAKALPTCIDRTRSRVGFAWGRKLLRYFTVPGNSDSAPDLHKQPSVYADRQAQVEPRPDFIGEGLSRHQVGGETTLFPL